MLPQAAFAGEAEYAEMVAAHARANGVPEALVHRVIMRESRYQPGLIGRGGTIGLMQIKLATARGARLHRRRRRPARSQHQPHLRRQIPRRRLSRRQWRPRPSRALFRGRLLLRCKAAAPGGRAGRQYGRHLGSSRTAIRSRCSGRRRIRSWPSASAMRGRRFPTTSHRHSGAMRSIEPGISSFPGAQLRTRGSVQRTAPECQPCG